MEPYICPDCLVTHIEYSEPIFGVWIRCEFCLLSLEIEFASRELVLSADAARAA